MANKIPRSYAPGDNKDYDDKKKPGNEESPVPIAIGGGTAAAETCGPCVLLLPFWERTSLGVDDPLQGHYAVQLPECLGFELICLK